MSAIHLFQLSLIAAAISLAIAVRATASDQWSGYLIDRMCSQAHRNDPQAINYVKNHTRDCALLKPCRASGYVLYRQGRWLNLDKNGSELAAQLISKSKSSRGIYVTVDGALSGETIKVEAVKEAAAE